MPKITTENADFKILEAFNGLEIVDADYKEQTFSKHVHEGYTIGVINKGAQRFYRSGSEHIADENAIILVNSDDVHTGESATTEGWRYRAMYPHPEHFQQVSDDLYEGKPFAPYFSDAVIKDPKISEQLRLLFSQVDQNASKLLIETILYNIMMSLTLRHSSLRTLPNDVSGSRQRLQMVKEYLDAYPEEDTSLTTLATMAGLSQFHFVRQFKKVFEIAPHGYQIQARLKKVKTLLQLGLKPAEVAIDCGFHDQSHLNRHFKKAMGTSLSKFQKQAILSKPC